MVIFPYADLDIYSEKEPTEWFPLEKENFNDFSHTLLNYSKDFEYFGEDGLRIFNSHKSEQELDNINLLYVTLTRAIEQLYVISKKIRADLYIHNCKSEVTVIPNALGGLSPKLKTRKTKDNCIRIIYFGKFQPYYDFKIVISVFKKLNVDFADVELHFWGNGVQYQDALNFSDNFAGIYFHGEYNRKDLNNLFNLKNDVFILPLKPIDNLDLFNCLSQLVLNSIP